MQADSDAKSWSHAITNQAAASYGSQRIQSFQERRRSKVAALRWLNNHIKLALFADCTRSLDPGSVRVLDIGCGHGDVLKMHRSGVASYLGLDCSAERVEEAKRRLAAVAPGQASRMQVACSDFLDAKTWPAELTAPGAAGRYDVVTMHFCIHYFMVSCAAAHQWMSHVARWLSADGCWIVTCVDAHRLKARLGQTGRWSNGVCSIAACPEQGGGDWPRYRFELEDCVQADEYVVDADWLIKVARMLGLECVRQSPFDKHPLYRKVRDLSQDERDVVQLYQMLVFKRVQKARQ